MSGITFHRRETAKGHRYYINGVYVPGVTTVLGCADKSNALVPWASRTTADWLADNISDGEVMTPELREWMRVQARMEAWRQKKEAGKVGSDVHDIIHGYLRTGDYDLAGTDEPTRNAFALWLEWWTERGLVPLALELPVCSVQLMVAGTLDCIAAAPDGTVWLLDWKSGKGIYREALAQTEAYRRMMLESRDLGIEGTNDLPDVDRIGVLRIGKTDDSWEFQEVPRAEWDRHWACFVALSMWVYGWMRDGKCRFEEFRQKVEVTA